MTVYIDTDYRCHVANADGRSAIETDFFDGKCDAFIEGYRFVPNGATWTRPDGEQFAGEMIAPAVEIASLTAAQAQYELDATIIAELDNALLDAAYENLTGGLDL